MKFKRDVTFAEIADLIDQRILLLRRQHDLWCARQGAALYGLGTYERFVTTALDRVWEAQQRCQGI